MTETRDLWIPFWNETQNSVRLIKKVENTDTTIDDWLWNPSYDITLHVFQTIACMQTRNILDLVQLMNLHNDITCNEVL